jgi:hypothetical protein
MSHVDYIEPGSPKVYGDIMKLSGICITLASIIAITTLVAPAATGPTLRLAARPANTHAKVDPARKLPSHLVFVAATNVLVYNADTGKLVRTISDGISAPFGLFVDSSLNLFVCNLGANSVSEYAPGATSPERTYTSGIVNPIRVTVSPTGDVFVANYLTESGGPGSVVAFHQGADKPYATFRIPGNAYVNGVATDSAGNLYVSFNKGDTFGNVFELPQAKKPGQSLHLKDLHNVSALTLDDTGTLLIGAPQEILAFPSGQRSGIHKISSDGYDFAFNADESRIYVANPAANEIQVFAYPDIQQVAVFAQGVQPMGVAVSPPAPAGRPY